MKKLVTLFMLLASTSSFADLQFQMDNIIGVWDLGNRYAILKITKQDDTSVKVLYCDRNKFLQSGGALCMYSSIAVYKYNSYQNIFYARKERYCSESFQVSQQYPNEMIVEYNPYRENSNCRYTGEFDQATKIIQ